MVWINKEPSPRSFRISSSLCGAWELCIEFRLHFNSQVDQPIHLLTIN
jgi:hypothetical protein